MWCVENQQTLYYEPTWESLSKKDAAPQWFEDAVFGIYFHWGIYSVPGTGCWTGINMYKKTGTEWEHVPDAYENTYHYIKETYGEPGIEFDYKDFIPMCTAENWDPDKWAELFNVRNIIFFILKNLKLL